MKAEPAPGAPSRKTRPGALVDDGNARLDAGREGSVSAGTPRARQRSVSEANLALAIDGKIGESVVMGELSGKWALVTGASRGVGCQVALGLARKGCNLLVHARQLDHLGGLLGALREAGVAAEGVAAELSQALEVDALLARVHDRVGTPDIVYNNAAIMTPWRDPHQTPLDDYRLSFEVNVIAPVRICDRLLPAMGERGSGKIVNVTSGIEHIRELLPYSLSKAALDRYVRDVSPSLQGSGVVLSLLDPGWLRTDLGGDQAPNAVESVLPGALVPALLPDDAQSGLLYCAQDYRTAE